MKGFNMFNSHKENILHRVADTLDEELNEYIIDILSGLRSLKGLDSKMVLNRIYYDNKEEITNDIIKMLEEEIVDLKEKNNKLYQKNMFKLSDSQIEEIEQWENTHECKNRNKSHGAIGGQYNYHFTPTSIGVFCEVQCSCGGKLDVSEV